MPRLTKCVVFVCMLWAVAVQPARGDTIGITGGFLDMQGSSGRLVLAGEQGFGFSSVVDVVGGSFGPWLCLPCDPGAVMPLDAHWSGKDLFGTATFRGVEFGEVGGLNSPHSMLIEFAGGVLLPPLGDEIITLVSPFSFSGTFLHDDGLREVLVGFGLATVRLAPGTPIDVPAWLYQSARYEFAPIPEPSTLLLISGGALAIGLRKWRRSGAARADTRDGAALRDVRGAAR